MKPTKVELVAHSIPFLSPWDEGSFFQRLRRLRCVETFGGEGTELRMVVRSGSLSDANLRELLALFFRYGVEMTQLAAFETDGNRSWFRSSTKYWHRRVFRGSGKRLGRGRARTQQRKA